MSRCFPFPPPGYEKKTRTENADFLTKEKDKEKKHTKEKRYKEKRENKEKREKEQCKDKNKEKKDEKEKHKDRKREEWNKGRTSKDKVAEGQNEGHNELRKRESLQFDEQRKDSKVAEELGRIGDDRATSSMDGGFSNYIQRKNGRMATSVTSQEKKRVADIEVFPAQIRSTLRRNDRNGLSFENVANSVQRRTVSTIPASALEKERSKMHELVPVGSGIEQNRNHGVSQPVESISGLFHSKTEGSAAGMEKKNCCENFFSVATGFERGKPPGANIMDASSLSATQRRKDVLGLSVGNLSSIHFKTVDMANVSIRRIEGIGAVPSIEKERTRGSEFFPNPVTSEQSRNSKFGKSVEKDRYRNVEKKDKTVVKPAEVRNGHKDRDHIDEWSKVKDKDKNVKEKKKEEKIEEKAEQVQHIELRNLGKDDQVDTLNTKPLAPHKNYTPGIIGIDAMSKKRKDLKNNGYLHEEDARPDKMPRAATSFQEMNGRVIEFPLTAPTSLHLKSGAMNILKSDQILENKENKINGTTKSHLLPCEVKPHPDSKFLSQIYSVPEMMEWSKIDDQDWLFNCCDSQQKSQTETEAQEAIHVLDEGLLINSTNVFVLPYVVPF